MLCYAPDSPNVWMITDEVDTVMLTMDHIDCPIRSSSISEQLHQSHAGCGVPLTGLHDVGVPSYKP